MFWIVIYSDEAGTKERISFLSSGIIGNVDSCGLTDKKCVPCEGGTPPLSSEKAQELHQEVATWQLSDLAIEKKFKFKDFKEAMGFVNQVAEIAEEEGHHPDMAIFYNKVDLRLTTHAADGLTENDFIVAAKIDARLDRSR